MLLRNKTNNLDASIAIVNTLVENGIITDKVSQVIGIDENEVELDIPITEDFINVMKDYPDFEVEEQVVVSETRALEGEVEDGPINEVVIPESDNEPKLAEQPVIATTIVDVPATEDLSQEEIYDDAAAGLTVNPEEQASELGDTASEIVDILDNNPDITYFNNPEITSASENVKEVIEEQELNNINQLSMKLQKKNVSRKQFNEETQGIEPEVLAPEVEETEKENLDDRAKIATGYGLSSISGKVKAFASKVRKTFAEEYGVEELDQTIDGIKTLMDEYSDVREKLVAMAKTFAEESDPEVDGEEEVIDTPETQEEVEAVEEEIPMFSEDETKEDEEKDEDEKAEIRLFSEEEIEKTEEKENADGEEETEEVTEDIDHEEFAERTCKVFSAAFKSDSVNAVKSEFFQNMATRQRK